MVKWIPFIFHNLFQRSLQILFEKMTKFEITKFKIEKFGITKFEITEFKITKFEITNLEIAKFEAILELKDIL